MLVSAEIRVLFCGSSQITLHGGVDSYRPPEVVFGFRACEKSDLFSVGCIFAELITQRPLFPSCENSPFSAYEKALLFDAVIGFSSSALTERLRLAHPGWFDAFGIAVLDDHVSKHVRKFLKSARIIQVNVSTEFWYSWMLTTSHFSPILPTKKRLGKFWTQCLSWIASTERPWMILNLTLSSDGGYENVFLKCNAISDLNNNCDRQIKYLCHTSVSTRPLHPSL